MPRSTTVRWTIALFTIATNAFTAPSLGAQAAGAALGLSLQRQSSGLWQSATRFDPAFQFNNPWFSVDGNLGVAKLATTSPIQVQDGQFDVRGESPEWRGFRLSTDGRIDRATSASGSPGAAILARTMETAESAVSFRESNTGAWLGLAAEQVDGLDGSNPLVRAGMWRQFGLVSVSLGVEQHSFRLIDGAGTGFTGKVDSLGSPIDTGRAFTSRLMRWSDVAARLSWSDGPIALDATLGVEPKLGAAPAAMWGHTTATIGVASRLSLVASLGTDASRVWMGLPASRFATLGVRVAPASLARPAPSAHVRPAAASFALRPDGRGAYVVTIRVPAARTVELSGDFNEWHAITLHEVQPDAWEATLALAPGTYHVNMRVNGDRWIAPPGLAATADDFNGTVGLLVVR